MIGDHVPAVLLACGLLGIGGCRKHGHCESRSYSVDVPPGWSARASAEFGCPEEARLSGPNGTYFVIARDCGAFLEEQDSSWVLERAGAGIRVRSEGAMCGRPVAGAKRLEDDTSAERCLAGDGNLTINAAVAFGRTRYEFVFGARGREVGVDLQPFRTIFAGFRAR